ncbi:MAG: isovaleryl-CoA dehydrogenase [Acidobacteria bacterium]|nr:isovaleryl-CoA dehydrogenase [Acidobacteriota bacterium]
MSAATHRVFNQPPPLAGYNLFTTDAVLREGVARCDADWALPDLHAFGAALGEEETMRDGFLANEYPPVLETHDRFGRRRDEIEFHPAWHHLMRLSVAQGAHALPWSDPRPGGHVARAALMMLAGENEAGHLCPLSMTYSAIPVLRLDPALAAEWESTVVSRRYDPRFRPVREKTGALIGMGMTEKQGGSDVRANTTLAEPAGGLEYRITGHKFFCSAPMSDAFLILAQAPRGLTCFFLPRWTPDGEVNAFHLQRLKRKLGNRSNASGEVEYRGAWARRIGEEGRGVATIMEMVQHTRLDCSIGSTALMRRALVEAVHHARHRAAFGRLLADQPLMRAVLADLAMETEAAQLATLRIARAFDRRASENALARLLVAAAKFWICKRAPAMIAEALECLGGSGYVEESILPRLYREAPVNSVWEGSGNVICLDVLRAVRKEPEAVEALVGELRETRGLDAAYDRGLGALETALGDADETRARALTEAMAKLLQASLMLRWSPAAATFCATRLGPDGGATFGALPAGADAQAIVDRAFPETR